MAEAKVTLTSSPSSFFPETGSYTLLGRVPSLHPEERRARILAKGHQEESEQTASLGVPITPTSYPEPTTFFHRCPLFLSPA